MHMCFCISTNLKDETLRPVEFEGVGVSQAGGLECGVEHPDCPTMQSDIWRGSIYIRRQKTAFNFDI